MLAPIRLKYWTCPLSQPLAELGQPPQTPWRSHAHCIGGYNNATSSMLVSTELFTLDTTTPANSTWSTTGNKALTLARAMHTSTLMSNGNVLVLGTYYATTGTVSNTTEIWTP